MNNVKRYALPIVLGAIAVALLIVGILSLTVWKPAQEVAATRDSQQPFSMTRAGVFPLYANQVNIRATGEPDQTVWMAIGDPADVAAWLQEEPYEEIVGLVGNLHTLKAIDHNLELAQSGAVSTDDAQSSDQPQSGELAQSGAAAAENPISSDMWTHVKYGRGSVSMDLSGAEMDMSVLIATDGVGPAPTLTLTWKTPQSNVLALASLVAAAVVALIALVIAFVLWNTRKRRLTRSEHLRGTEDRALTETAAIDMSAGIDELPKRASTKKKKKEQKKAEPIEAPEETLDEEILDEETLDEDAQPEEKFAPETTADPQVSDVKDSEDQGEDEEETPDPEPVAEVEDSKAPSDEEGKAEEAVKPEPEPVVETPLEPARTETVTTDSGMMNLSALQGGGAFPTRRALRDARKRGVNHLVVGERSFDTAAPKGADEDPAQALRERSIGATKWSEAMGETD